MKHRFILLSLFILSIFAVVSLAQFQAQTQIDPRVGPIYPVNPTYNFSSNQSSDPFQFNWGTGHWDYVPFAGRSESINGEHYAPPPIAPYSGAQPPYVFSSPPTPITPSVPPSSPTANAPLIQPPPTPDDSPFWMAAATQPEKSTERRIVKFEGRIVAIRATNLNADPNPHVLLRLMDKLGSTGTVDVGQRLSIPEAAFDPSVKGYVVATGQLGVLDGHLILFADEITFGTQDVLIERRGQKASK